MEQLKKYKNKITKNKNDGNVHHLEITEVVLVYCNIDNNDYQQDSRLLCPLNYIFSKLLIQNFKKNKVWFTDQNGQLLEIEHRLNLILIIK